MSFLRVDIDGTPFKALVRHLALKGGEEHVFRTPVVVQITNVSYGEEIVDADNRSVVKLKFMALTPVDDDDDDDKESGLTEATTVLCALTPGKVFRFSLFMKILFFILSPDRTCCTEHYSHQRWRLWASQHWKEVRFGCCWSLSVWLLDLLLALFSWRVIIWVSCPSNCLSSCSHFPL